MAMRKPQVRRGGKNTNINSFKTTEANVTTGKVSISKMQTKRKQKIGMPNTTEIQMPVDPLVDIEILSNNATNDQQEADPLENRNANVKKQHHDGYSIIVKQEPESRLDYIESTQPEPIATIPNNEVEMHFDSTNKHLSNDESKSSLYPITEQLRQRIRRMKFRMVATLKLTDAQLDERRKKRAQQTKESRQRSKSSNPTAFMQSESAKRALRHKLHKEYQTLEDLKTRRAQNREGQRRYVAKRNATETEGGRAARLAYLREQRLNKKPIKF